MVITYYILIFWGIATLCGNFQLTCRKQNWSLYIWAMICKISWIKSCDCKVTWSWISISYDAVSCVSQIVLYTNCNRKPLVEVLTSWKFPVNIPMWFQNHMTQHFMWVMLSYRRQTNRYSGHLICRALIALVTMLYIISPLNRTLYITFYYLPVIQFVLTYHYIRVRLRRHFLKP